MRRKTFAKRCTSMALAAVLAAAGMTVAAKPEKALAAGTVNEKEQAGDENNSRATAEELPADTTMLGKIVYGKDEKESDYYKFTIKGKGYYTFKLENYELATDIGYGWNMTIYDEDMNEFLSYDVEEGSVESRKLAYKEGTVFYIIVRDVNTLDSGYTSWRTQEAIYGLTAVFAEDKSWESESNDTATTANVVEKGKINGSLVKGDDVDYYKYTAKDTGYIKAYVENTLGDVDNVAYGWIFNAYDKDMNDILKTDSFKTVSRECDCIVKKGQVVYFKVEAYDSYNDRFTKRSPIDVQYTLNVSFTKTGSVEKESNDSYNQANTIKKSIFGVVGDSTNKHEEDWFKFAAGKSGNTKIKVDIPDLANSYKVTVYDSKKKEVKSMSINSSKTLKFKTQKGQKYYVCVENENGGSLFSSSYSYGFLYKLTIK